MLPKVGAVHEHDAPLGELLRLEAVGPLTEVGNELPAGQGLRAPVLAEQLPPEKDGHPSMTTTAPGKRVTSSREFARAACAVYLSLTRRFVSRTQGVKPGSAASRFML